ncbi:hypothetical protein PVK62_16795 [Aliivibrio sp. S3MY1]|jgi:hypothetical protein|uniref:LPO_1073/Vpar_1526 family protein n=1 Tax=unclassified Aliivibrio TaxID=2645654 RepID=UPI0023798DD7|nr:MULTISPECIES: LPO_1073/Vpar_1526 family protein [unclassified Aliivibrio]MDD9197485.1 hypothetical protein [Aliivibrio sp. S3MY1]MDD9200734.1 hypothetical protein [Aliivibrio sp. S2MY1]
MLGDKQVQKVDGSGTAIQAGGNINISHSNGLSYMEVKELCLLFLRDNFPALRDEAIQAAEENVSKFAADLEKKIIEKSEFIDVNRFKDPDVQAAINDAVQASARRGEKANPETLINLLTEKISNSSNELLDIVLSEAIIVASKMTKEQIAYLTFIHFMTNIGVNDLQHISQIERYAVLVGKLSNSGSIISDAQKQYLVYTGVCTIDNISSIDIYKGWMETFYAYFNYADMEAFKADLTKFCPTSKLMLDNFDADSGNGQVSLTTVGKAIAIANISRKWLLDYTIWIK